MDDLQFYILFSSISVISGQWEDDNGRLCAMELCLWLRRFCLERDQTRSARSVGRNLTHWMGLPGSMKAFSFLKMLLPVYRKNSKNWDTWNKYHNCPTIGTVGFYIAVLCSKDANRITNREDPDQTAPWGAVWSGSALFAQTYLSQYLKLLP